MSTMAEILTDHQRQNSSSCLCGWSKLGRSHPEHQEAELVKAGYGNQADAWDAGHWTQVEREMDDCRCGAWSEGECGCGKYGSGKIITPNPYRSQS